MKRKKYWILATIIVLTSLSPLKVTLAQGVNKTTVFNQNNTDMLQAAYQQLTITQQKNEVATQQLEQLKKTMAAQLDTFTTTSIDKGLLDKAALDVAVASANNDSANLAQAEAQQAVDATSAKISALEGQLQDITLAAGKTTAVKTNIANLQAALNFQKAIAKSQQKLVQELSTSQQIAKNTLQVLTDWQNKLIELQKSQEQQAEQAELQQKETLLQAQQKDWLNKLTSLNAQLKALDPKSDNYAKATRDFEIEIVKAQEQSNLVHLRLVLLNLTTQLASLKQQPLDELSATDLNNSLSQLDDINTELTSIADLTQRKIDLLQRRAILEKEQQQQGMESSQDFEYRNELINNLLNNYQLQAKTVAMLTQYTQSYRAKAQLALTKALARRQGLPGSDMAAWRNLLFDVMKMPVLALQSASALKDQLIIALDKLNAWSIVLISAVEFFWFWAWLVLRDLLAKLIANLSDKRQNMSKNTLYILLQLIQRNLLGIFILAGLSILFWLVGLPLKSFTLLIYLALVWIVFKFAIGLSRLVLLENVGDASGKDSMLYNELKWALLAGGILTTFTVLAHQLPVGYQVTDVFDRLFMLFMFITAVLLLRGRQVGPALLSPYFKGAKPYLMRVIKLLSLLIPLTILSTALVGIFGYVDLAWAMSWYEGVLLLVITGFLLARGFLKDFMEWVSEMFIREFQHGWLWTQAFLRPVDRILKIGLFLGAIVVLFHIYGWTLHSPVVQNLNKMLHFQLVNAKGLVLTPISIIELVIAGAVIYWVSRWTREFSYRWGFAKTQDLGLRNSLAVLSQYMVFIVSLFIALKIIGIDLSGISYVLAGFAAGIGLGLRDIVKNYASGLLLLFERPIRNGDLVTIGTTEGEVTNIGMRAITVKTWDHMEVVVPNSETFEKPFTNWTHFDSIVRTAFDVTVSREDDPFFVQALILNVLKDSTEIVDDPAPQVLFKELDKALLSFEIRYYVDIQVTSSRSKVRSDLLFRIFTTLKQHGIRAPYPPQDIFLYDMLNDAKERENE